MIGTRRRLRQLRAEELRQVELSPHSTHPGLGPWLTQPGAVRRSRAAWLGAAWFAAMIFAIGVEPSPAGAASDPAWGAVVDFAMMGALTATVVGLARRQRMGLIASVGAVGVALFATVMCPVSGHHTSVGAWWFAQMAGFLVVGALSLAALRASRAR